MGGGGGGVAETTIYFVVGWVLFECSSFDNFPYMWPYASPGVMGTDDCLLLHVKEYSTMKFAVIHQA